MKTGLRKFIAWSRIALFLSLFVLNSEAVFALPQISITVKNPDPYTGNQSWFVYKKNVNEVIKDIASIKNFGDQPTTVKISSVDATSNNSGSFILKFEQEEQKGIGVWTEIEKKEFTIQPGERIDVPFTITIPQNATPGQYLGGIVAENGSGEDKTIKPEECDVTDVCKTSVSVKTRIGARIYLTIAGEVKEDIQLTEFSHGINVSGKHYFTFQIENNGNVSYEPKAKIQIIDSMGNRYDEFEKSLGESTPNSVINPTVNWDKTPPLFGQFTAKATVSFPKRLQMESENLHGASLDTVKTLHFWVIPWIGLLLIMVMVGGGLGSYGYAHFRWKKIMKNSERHEVEEKEDIISIAEKNNIPWKKLARINKLKPPYVLKKGDSVYIPKAKNKDEKGK